jgi:hypothetical protein
MNENWNRFYGRGLPAAVFAIFMMFLSCEKIVSVDLNKAAPHLVIEGVITDRPGPYFVALTLTGDYFEPALSFPPVSGARVILTNDVGLRDTLKEASTGVYESTNLKGIPGLTYSMTVVAEGREYAAASFMPAKTLIDSLYARPRQAPDGDRNYDIYVMFKDRPQPGNYYRINARSSSPIPADSIDGKRYRLFTDELTNGNEMTERIRAGRNVNAGDTITIELLSIDRAAYDYFHTLRDILTSDRSPTSLSPANPNTNISGGALGYFAAYAVDSKRIVLR